MLQYLKSSIKWGLMKGGLNACVVSNLMIRFNIPAADMYEEWKFIILVMHEARMHESKMLVQVL